MAVSDQIRESLLQAIDIIASKRAEENNAYDKTIICKVTDNSQALTKGYYTVSNDTISFNAYSDNTSYKIGAYVRVSIPNGDYSQQKYIAGLYQYNDGQAINYITPLDTFLDAATLVDQRSNSQAPVNGEFGMAANGQLAEQAIWSMENWSDDSHYIKLQKNSIYDTIGIQADFKCLLGNYDIRSGSYGLRVDLNVKLNDNSQAIHSLFLDSSNFFGNPYNLQVYSTQTQVYDISKIDTISGLSLHLYQKDFTYYDENTKTIKYIDVVKKDQIEISNIFVSNIYVALGSDLYQIPNNTVKLYTKDSLEYKFYDYSDLTNQKTLSVLWYNKDTNNSYVGYGDGKYDEEYDEIEYLKKVKANDRLVAQQSNEIDNTVGALNIAANLNEADPLLKQILSFTNSNIIQSLQSFRNLMLNCGNAQDEITTWIDKIGTIVGELKTDDIPVFKKNIKSYIAPGAEPQGNIEPDICAKLNQIQTIENLFSGDIFAPNILKAIVEEGYTSYKGIYDSYNKIMNNSFKEFNILYEKIKGLIETEIILDFLDNKTPFIPLDFSPYNNKYSLYWYRYNPKYYNEDELFMEPGWEPIIYDDKYISEGLPKEEDPDNPGYLIKKCPEEDNQYIVNLDYKTKTEKFKVVIIYNHAVYYSNELVFTNSDEIIDENRFYEIDALYLEHDKNSQESYQTFYKSSGAIMNPGATSANRAIKLGCKDEYGGDIILGGAQVYWYIPNSTTMLKSNKEYLIKCGYLYLEPNADGQGSKYYENGYDCFYKQIFTMPDDESKIEEWKNVLKNELLFYYQIRDYHVATHLRNTIKCKVIQNEFEIDLNLSLIFGTLGTNGTDYSLVVTPSTSQICVSAKINEDDNGDLPLSVHLFNFNGEPVENNYKPKLEWIGPTSYDAVGDTNSIIISQLKNQSKFHCGILKVTKTVNIITKKDKTKLIDLSVLYPVPWGERIDKNNFSSTYYIDGPTTIVYDSQGKNPVFDKKSYRIYDGLEDIEITKNITWHIKYYNSLNEEININSDEYLFYNKYMPSLTDNNMLQPSNIYISNCDCYPVVYAVLNGTDILWAQPLVIMQNRYPSPMLNAWDGEFEINEEAGTILSTMVGAGKKEDDNSFSGVLIGEVSIAQAEVGKNDVFSTNHDGLGLYGFHHGAQSFGFNIDGTVFIGKSGGGRISFDGNNGFIYSANWLKYFKDNNKDPFNNSNGIIGLNPGQDGMAIDLQNGHIDAYNFKLTSSGIQLNSNPNNNENYVWIGDNENYIKYTKIIENDNEYLKFNLVSPGMRLNSNPKNNENYLQIGNPQEKGSPYITYDKNGDLKINVSNLIISGEDIKQYIAEEITTDNVFKALDGNVTGLIITGGSAYIQATYLRILDKNDKQLLLADGTKNQVEIAGWQVTNTSLIKNTDLFGITIKAPNSYGGPGNNGANDFIVLENKKPKDGEEPYPFVVTSNGTLRATKAEITGVIHAKGGDFINCTIEESCTVKGVLNCNKGNLGDWQISSVGLYKHGDNYIPDSNYDEEEQIYYGMSSKNSIYLLPNGGVNSGFAIGNHIATKEDPWVFTVSNTYGITQTGSIYASDASFLDSSTSGVVLLNRDKDNLHIMKIQNNGFEDQSNKDHVGWAMFLDPYGISYTYRPQDSDKYSMAGMIRFDFNNGYTGKLAGGTWFIEKLGESSEIISDKTKKNSINSQSSVYSQIFDKLKPAIFKYNHGTSDRIHTGLIAQEVEDAVISAGLETKDFAAICYDINENGEKVNYGIRYEELISLCIYEIQKLKAKIKEF